MTHNDIVQKLWNLCDVLRDDGINYSDYVTELVLLLFIKMVHENTENGTLQQHTLHEDLLITAIYADAQIRLREPRHLKQLVTALDGIDWFSAQKDGLGDLYEGLLEEDGRSLITSNMTSVLKEQEKYEQLPEGVRQQLEGITALHAPFKMIESAQALGL